MKNSFLPTRVVGLCTFCLLCVLCASAQQTTFEFSTAQRGPVIGPLHYGIFYEEINHAGDGGIYARTLDMFMIEVDREKYPDVEQEYRFVRVE